MLCCFFLNLHSIEAATVFLIYAFMANSPLYNLQVALEKYLEAAITECSDMSQTGWGAGNSQTVFCAPCPHYFFFSAECNLVMCKILFSTQVNAPLQYLGCRHFLELTSRQTEAECSSERLLPLNHSPSRKFHELQCSKNSFFRRGLSQSCISLIIDLDGGIFFSFPLFCSATGVLLLPFTFS